MCIYIQSSKCELVFSCANDTTDVKPTASTGHHRVVGRLRLPETKACFTAVGSARNLKRSVTTTFDKFEIEVCRSKLIPPNDSVAKRKFRSQINYLDAIMRAPTTTKTAREDLEIEYARLLDEINHDPDVSPDERFQKFQSGLNDAIQRFGGGTAAVYAAKDYEADVQGPVLKLTIKSLKFDVTREYIGTRSAPNKCNTSVLIDIGTNQNSGRIVGIAGTYDRTQSVDLAQVRLFFESRTHS